MNEGGLTQSLLFAWREGDVHFETEFVETLLRLGRSEHERQCLRVLFVVERVVVVVLISGLVAWKFVFEHVFRGNVGEVDLCVEVDGMFTVLVCAQNKSLVGVRVRHGGSDRVSDCD